MAVYNFLAVAPCSFVIDQKAFNLKAGEPFSTNEIIGEKLLNPHFTYSNFVRLIQSPPIKVEQVEVSEVAPEVAVVEPVYEQTEPALFDEQLNQEIEEPKVEIAVETEIKKYNPKTRKRFAEKLAEEEVE